jgi:hypothetical protein
LAARIAQTGADVDVSVCRLIFAGRELEDDLTLADYNCEQARKRHFLSHLYIKCIILPRQARDKHRENSKKCRFLAGI